MAINITSNQIDEELRNCISNLSISDEEELEINVELIIKGQSQMVPLTITVKRLAEELVQIQSELIFSRTDFNIGIGKWSNTTILRDKIKIKKGVHILIETVLNLF